MSQRLQRYCWLLENVLFTMQPFHLNPNCIQMLLGTIQLRLPLFQALTEVATTVARALYMQAGGGEPQLSSISADPNIVRFNFNIIYNVYKLTVPVIKIRNMSQPFLKHLQSKFKVLNTVKSLLYMQIIFYI